MYWHWSTSAGVAQSYYASLHPKITLIVRSGGAGGTRTHNNLGASEALCPVGATTPNMVFSDSPRLPENVTVLSLIRRQLYW